MEGIFPQPGTSPVDASFSPTQFAQHTKVEHSDFNQLDVCAHPVVCLLTSYPKSSTRPSDWLIQPPQREDEILETDGILSGSFASPKSVARA
ncbi:unnamed protein product [Protopolystoma xenopodis]|uniref:Uncharacterized protein n=1 Tax=Protopolystoma xenopodis TaxID=117903 RepID=A0A3S5B4L1_9PLAT|nr:unnamed protein product [Protopolystoma xenopodis]